MTQDASARRTIGILLFDGVEELDAVGPWEVLAGSERAREVRRGIQYDPAPPV